MLRGKRGGLVDKGVELVLGIFLVAFLPTILIIVQQVMQDNATQAYGNSSAVYAVASSGTNATQKFSAQLPMAATVSGIVILILLVGFALGDYLKRRNENQPPPGFNVPPGFGG